MSKFISNQTIFTVLNTAFLPSFLVFVPWSIYRKQQSSAPTSILLDEGLFFFTPFVIQVLYSPAHPFFALHHPLYMGNQKHRRHSTCGFVNPLHNTFSMSLYPPKILFLAHHRTMFAVFIVRNCEIDVNPPSKNLTFLNWETSCWPAFIL